MTRCDKLIDVGRRRFFARFGRGRRRCGRDGCLAIRARREPHRAWLWSHTLPANSQTSKT